MKLMSINIAVFLLCLYASSFNTLYANHAMAADLRYDWISGNQYEIWLYFYFDCSSSIQDTPPIAPLISCSSPSCGQYFSVSLQQDATMSGNEVSQLCPTAFSSCNGGAYPGVELYVYRSTITLPENCSDWTIAYQLPTGQTRSADITNLFTPDFYRIYTEATLNNSTGGNSSPQIGNFGVFYSCITSGVFQQHFSDADGDSLVCSLVPPLDSPNNTIPYVGGLNSQNPLNGSCSIDAQTGDISYTPLGAQRPVIGILVEEYRNGIKIGSMRRDMQWLIVNCNNQGLNVDNPYPSSNINSCVNTPIDFTLNANDLDGNNIVVTSNISSFPSSAQLTVSSAPPASGYDKTLHFTWTPTAADIGTYLLELNLTDNSCPIPAHWEMNYLISVYDYPDLGFDLSVCNDNTNPIAVTANNGNQFVWSPVPATQNNNGSLAYLVPPTAIGDVAVYVVQNECGLSDTIQISRQNTFIASIMPNNPTVCASNSGVVLYAEPNGSQYSYLWQPEASVNVPTDAIIYATPQQETVYSVQITDNSNGCVASASTMVGFSNFTGTVLATADADSICSGASVQLQSHAIYLAQLHCGIADTPCNGIDTVVTIGTRADSSFNFTPYNGFWENGRLQILYTVNDLQSQGMLQGGTIERLGFYVTRKFSTAPIDDFHIKMGCTNANTVENFIDGLSEVYMTDHLNTTAQSWNNYTLDTPFVWDGTSNVVIEICHHSDNPNQFDEIACSISNSLSIIKAQTSIGSTPCNITNNSLVTNLLPDLQIQFCLPEIDTTATQITWTPTEGLSNPNIANPIATPTSSMTYVAHYENNGCTGSNQVSIVVRDAAIQHLQIVADSLICDTQIPIQLPLSLAETLPTNAQVLWSAIDELDNPNAPSPTLSFSQSQTISVSAQLNDACNTLLYDSLQIELLPPVDLQIVPDHATITEGDNITLSATGNFSQLHWESSDIINTPTALSIIVSPNTTTDYVAIAQDPDGCDARDTIQVQVLPRINTQCFLLPNAFSPNGDLVNDLFRPTIYSPNELLSLKIYNRFGEQVFSSTDINFATWDGSYRGIEQPMGVYVFYLELLCDGKLSPYKGNLTLIR